MNDYAKINFSDLVAAKGTYYFLSVAKKVKAITILINANFFSNTFYWGKMLNIIILELKRLNIESFIYILEEDKPVDLSDKRFSSDAFIFIGAKRESAISQITALKKPHIFIDPIKEQAQSTIVSHDNFAAGYKCAKIFYDMGHLTFCFLDADSRSLSYEKRYNGFASFLTQNKIEDFPRISPMTEAKNISDIYNFSDILKLSKRPTAFFCASDFILLSAFSMFKKLNLSVPEDISIISFDNSNPHDIDNISVDSFGISVVNMALTALYILLIYIDSGTISLPMDICIDTILVKRGSVKNPKEVL
ncbi:MAG: LacI family transcriptional regulator [Ruminococcaceae bacterium]|nr:LacI family transcriptional regulator [Oscillospiraceae bacterium]